MSRAFSNNILAESADSRGLSGECRGNSQEREKASKSHGIAVNTGTKSLWAKRCVWWRCGFLSSHVRVLQFNMDGGFVGHDGFCQIRTWLHSTGEKVDGSSFTYVFQPHARGPGIITLSLNRIDSLAGYKRTLRWPSCIRHSGIMARQMVGVSQI